LYNYSNLTLYISKILTDCQDFADVQLLSRLIVVHTGLQSEWPHVWWLVAALKKRFGVPKIFSSGTQITSATWICGDAVRCFPSQMDHWGSGAGLHYFCGNRWMWDLCCNQSASTRSHCTSPRRVGPAEFSCRQPLLIPLPTSADVV